MSGLSKLVTTGTNSGGGSTSPLTTKGDLYTHNVTVDARLPVGTNGQFVSADSTQATGLKWVTASGTGNITDINTDATPSQLLTVGTTGTDFAIVDDGIGGHAFNLPSASATARGVVTTGAQTLAGAKTLSSAPVLSSLTASTVPYLDAGKAVASSAVTPTELGYVSGVTSALQTQLGTKAPLASPTFTTAITFGNYKLQPSENDAGNSSTAITLDWTTGSAQKVTLTGNVTFTLTNPQTGGAYMIKIATGAGSFTATWPASVKWSGGTAPTITVTASKVDLINFYWDGTSYYGSYVQNF